eukprot:gene13142-8988_t
MCLFDVSAGCYLPGGLSNIVALTCTAAYFAGVMLVTCLGDHAMQVCRFLNSAYSSTRRSGFGLLFNVTLWHGLDLAQLGLWFRNMWFCFAVAAFNVHLVALPWLSLVMGCILLLSVWLFADVTLWIRLIVQLDFINLVAQCTWDLSDQAGRLDNQIAF